MKKSLPKLISRLKRDVPPLFLSSKHPRVCPVVVAPMAGVTNRAFRRLVYELGAGMAVSEMVTARGLVEQNQKTWDYINFDAPSEVIGPRSVQLYSVCPKVTEKAVTELVNNNHVDHIDLNFGCPAKKITKKGGGAALLARPDWLGSIVKAAVKAAGEIPVTLKYRTGIDESRETYIDIGLHAQDLGVKMICLHARSAAQQYSGKANWDKIANLKQKLSIPVFGNGDVFTVEDAEKLWNHTDCDGVVIGRGVLGKPWLPGQIKALWTGSEIPDNPKWGELVQILKRHLSYEVEQSGEQRALLGFRKHITWYVTGFAHNHEIKRRLATVSSVAEIDDLFDAYPENMDYPDAAMHAIRGKSGRAQAIALPHGYLSSKDAEPNISPLAEVAISGG